MGALVKKSFIHSFTQRTPVCRQVGGRHHLRGRLGGPREAGRGPHRAAAAGEGPEQPGLPAHPHPGQQAGPAPLADARGGGQGAVGAGAVHEPAVPAPARLRHHGRGAGRRHGLHGGHGPQVEEGQRQARQVTALRPEARERGGQPFVLLLAVAVARGGHCETCGEGGLCQADSVKARRF